MKTRRPTPAEAGWRNRLLRWLRRAPTPSASPPAVNPSPGLATELESILRENERIWSGFRALEIEMFAADTLADVFTVLIRNLPRRFAAVQQVSVAWRDPDYEIQRMLSASKSLLPGFVGLKDPAAMASLPQHRPWLGPADASVLSVVFPRALVAEGSMAIMPLLLRGEWVGTLNQFSPDPAHFTSATATDLLEHLAAVTALCIDNAINRACLQRDGLTDPLTGVANRRFFERRMHEEASLWQRHGGQLACLLADLDHFKLINDRHGHEAGDAVLQHVAGLLNQGLRTSDVLARYGGEEFVLLLPATGLARAREIAERLRSRVSQSRSENRPGVTLSVGVAALQPAQQGTLQDPHAWLLRRADEMLYRAKARGRNCVVADSTESLAAT
jgi:diguanylate cyclase (GGDEF)-like protein